MINYTPICHNCGKERIRKHGLDMKGFLKRKFCCKDCMYAYNKENKIGFFNSHHGIYSPTPHNHYE